MKRFSEQLKKQSESIRLRTNERHELRDRLVSYIEYHPLPIEMRQSVPTPAARPVGIAAEPFQVLPINWFWVRNFSAAFALFIMVVVPVAAEHTTPGDVLYPVKVRFNEEVRSSLTLSPYEKIEWETTRLERRIAEARQLASEGKLTDDVEAQVVEAVKEHSEKAKNEIAVLRQTDSDEAAIAEITFASALAVQSEVLQKTVENTTVATSEDPVSPNKIGAVLASVVAHESDLADANQAVATPSYEKLLARVEKESTDTYELFESVKNQASEGERADVERRLSDIERKIVDAMAMVATGGENTLTLRASSTELVASTSLVTETASSSATSTNTEVAASTTEPVLVEALASPSEAELVARKEEAVGLLRDALADLKKLMSFMTDITVRQSVTVDSLVPITLTTDERRAAINESLLQIETLTEQYASTTFNGEKAEKLTVALSDLDAAYANAKVAFTAGDLVGAENHLNIALSLMKNIAAMSDTVAVPETETEPIDRSTTTVPESTDIDVAE